MGSEGAARTRAALSKRHSQTAVFTPHWLLHVYKIGKMPLLTFPSDINKGKTFQVLGNENRQKTQMIPNSIIFRAPHIYSEGSLGHSRLSKIC